MYNFHFAKIIAGVGPLLAKETILSKVVNMVDVFRVSLSGGFDDNNKKYIETVMKLDNSKSIMFETRGNNVRVKNIYETKLKKGQKIEIEFSEYAQESKDKIFLDYEDIYDVENGVSIQFRQGGINIKIIDRKSENLIGEVIVGGDVIPYDVVEFDKYLVDKPFFSDKDKRDILWGLSYNIHMISASYVKTVEDIQHIKTFLANNNAGDIKVFSKIETAEAVKNIIDIIAVSDGIVISVDVISQFLRSNKMSVDYIIDACKLSAKPVFVNYVYGMIEDSYELMQKNTIKKYCEKGVDGYMMDVMIREDDPVRVCSVMFDNISEISENCKPHELNDFYKGSDFIIRDYIIHNACRITKDLDVRAIVCFTQNGYTPARLSSLNTNIPIIAFSSVDTTYRYINTLWGVKGFKISPNFNYQNLKRIGKEMIRIIFKGNIALDDKIVIVQANEMNRDDKTDMINGVELYKFKNI